MNDPEASQVYNSDSIATLDSKTVVGQSFVSRRPNFNGITIWITPLVTQETALNSSIQNTIDIKVFHSPDDAFPLYSTSVSTPMSGKNIPINIQIPNQGNPEEEKFFITLSTNSGSFQINGRNENAYPFGQVYIDNKPVNADIAYRSSYMYDFDALEEDINQGIKYAWLLIPLLIILWLPGWLLLEASGLRIRYDFGEQTALSVGISLSVIPILMLWTTIFNIKWTDEGVLFISILLVALWLARVIYINIRAKKNTYNNPSLEQPASPLHGNNHHLLISVILLLIFLTTLTIRMIMVRDLATPAWVDSVHHALITQQIISLGAYPSSYAPYLDINPASYHPGFHSIAAAFTMLSKLKIDQSLLIIGQVINALTIFSVYLFTKVLTQSSLSGLFAAMITGFLTPMPAYYTSWGRYTELAGLLMLPVAFAFILILIERNATKQYYWIIFLCALVSGGLFLVHYRVAVFFGCLILSYFVIYMLITKKKPHKIIARGLLLIFIVVVAAIILVYPWMVQTITNTVYPIIKSTGMRTVPFFQDFSWAFLTAALGKLSLVLAGLGLIWGMLLQRRFSYLLLLWIVSLFLLANFDALRLPGGGLISNLSVEIMLFIPISVLGGFFIDQIINSWKDLVPQRLILLFIGSIVFLSLLVVYNGSKQLITILNPITILSRNADLPAIDWISKNIPEDETIVVNPFVWGYGLYAGSDGGYWISPLTGRLTLPPPVLYGLGSDRERINEEIQEVINISPNPMDLWEYLRTNRLHYIFIGEKGGVLSPEKLSSSDLFTIVYQNDGVWIFKTKPVR